MFFGIKQNGAIASKGLSHEKRLFNPCAESLYPTSTEAGILLPYNCSGRLGISLGGRERKKKRKPHLWCVPVSVFTSGRVRVNEFAHTSIFCRVDILGCFSIDRLVGLTLHLAFCSIPHFLRPRNWHTHSTVTDREQMGAPFSLNWQPQCRVSCGLGFSLPPSFPGIFPWNCVLEIYSSI